MRHPLDFYSLFHNLSLYNFIFVYYAGKKEKFCIYFMLGPFAGEMLNNYDDMHVLYHVDEDNRLFENYY